MENKHILIGVTAGIAAYKTATLIRYFKKLGAEVKVIMTPASSDFITPLTLATLSQNPVAIDWYDKSNGVWTNHVELAKWADVFVIAPLTASSLSKLAHGEADNLLVATYLSATCPIVVAPAMDLDMYQHPTTQRNLDKLQQDGVTIIPAEDGFLASGLHGQGRMQEPETIGEFVRNFTSKEQPFRDKKILITAGPTHENIDPVRFIGNSSTGKMGFEIAHQLLQLGAEVFLIAGPTHQKLVADKLHRIDVTSAEEMLLEVQKYWNQCQIGIFSAAVSDYRPVKKESQKIKKDNESMHIELVKNPDILKWAGENKKGQFLLGFALETQDAINYAKGKIVAKNLDAIVVNSLEDKGAGFGETTNLIKIIDRSNKIYNFELKDKRLVAKDIVEFIQLKYEN